MSCSPYFYVSYHYTKLLNELLEHAVETPRAHDKKDCGDVKMLDCQSNPRPQELLA